MMRLIFILVMVFMSLKVMAQTKLPSSNGHVFVPVFGLRNPQPVTNATIQIGFAETTEFNVPLVELDSGEVLGLNGDLTFITFNVATSIRIKEWISFRIRYGLTTRIGTDVKSLLSQGFTKLDAAESQWQFRILKSDKFYLSSAIGINRFEVEFLDVRGYVDDLLNGEQNSSLNRKIKSLTGEIALLGSYAFNNMIGISAEVTLETGENLDDRNIEFFWGLTGSADINLEPRFNIPIGAAFFYATNNLPEFVIEETRRANLFKYRLAYTGSDEFSIGVEFTNNTLPLNDVSSRVKTSGINLTAFMYF
jgi:hypothetical protein